MAEQTTNMHNVLFDISIVNIFDIKLVYNEIMQSQNEFNLRKSNVSPFFCHCFNYFSYEH